MTVKIQGQLPDGEANGLVVITRKLIDDPQAVHVIVALVDCKKTTTDYDTGIIEPTARIRRCEVITDLYDGQKLMQLMRRALEHRTGKAVLPLDMEDELVRLFGSVSYASDPPSDVDPETGEIKGRVGERPDDAEPGEAVGGFAPEQGDETPLPDEIPDNAADEDEG